MLTCYDCFLCTSIDSLTGQETCEENESCITVAISGKTKHDGYVTDIDRLCDSGTSLWNQTELDEADWTLWSKSYCALFALDFIELYDCTVVHCDSDLCNNLTSDMISTTEVSANDYFMDEIIYTNPTSTFDYQFTMDDGSLSGQLNEHAPQVNPAPEFKRTVVKIAQGNICNLSFIVIFSIFIRFL